MNGATVSLAGECTPRVDRLIVAGTTTGFPGRGSTESCSNPRARAKEKPQTKKSATAIIVFVIHAPLHAAARDQAADTTRRCIGNSCISLCEKPAFANILSSSLNV